MNLKAAAKPVVLALAALGWLLAAQPAGAAVSVEQLLPRPETGRPLRLSLEGLPPAPCPYRLEAAESTGDSLVLRLAHGAGCAADATAGTLTVEPPGMSWGRNGVVRVRVEDDGGAGDTPRLLGFGLVQVGRVLRIAHPEAGYWWNEAGGEFDRAGPGIGLNLERQGNTLSVTVLGYAADGRPEWLFGAGPIHGQLARVPLSRLHGGAGPFDPWQAPGDAEPAGVVHFEFRSEARAVAWFERSQDEAINLQPLSLVRFRFDERPSEAALGEWLFVGGIALGDPVTHAESLTFLQSEPREDGFRLQGADGAPTLDCSLDRARPNSPPARCVLRDADGTLLVDFGDIALGRMRGWRPDGASVTAVHRLAD